MSNFCFNNQKDKGLINNLNWAKVLYYNELAICYSGLARSSMSLGYAELSISLLEELYPQLKKIKKWDDEKLKNFKNKSAIAEVIKNHYVSIVQELLSDLTEKINKKIEESFGLLKLAELEKITISTDGDYKIDIQPFCNKITKCYSGGVFYLEYFEPLNSMEQLWLAFVMKEKYNKTWNGEEW